LEPAGHDRDLESFMAYSDAEIPGVAAFPHGQRVVTGEVPEILLPESEFKSVCA
jgi:hypothetical protein